MLKSLFKKKISEDKLANALLNSLIGTIENGFSEIADLINNDPDFVKKANIDKSDYDQFLFIVFVGNILIMRDRLDREESEPIEEQLVEKFANAYELTTDQTKQYIKDYSSFMSRINYPSKNTLYGMSKSVFYKYKLSQYQDDYFKDLNTPNPVFLKRLNELMNNFIWDWDYFLEKFKVD